MSKQLRQLLGLFLAASLTTASAAGPAPRTYAQQLVTETIQANPDMTDVIFHVTPPQAKENVAIASYTATELGRPAGEDDLGVIKTGKPLVEVQKDGVRVGIIIPLYDQAAHTIGALGMMYSYHQGEDPQKFLHRAETTRDRLAKRIPSLAALFRPGTSAKALN